MKIYLGTDHAGFDHKENVKEFLMTEFPCEIMDKGAHELNGTDDYPDHIEHCPTHKRIDLLKVFSILLFHIICNYKELCSSKLLQLLKCFHHIICMHNRTAHANSIDASDLHFRNRISVCTTIN